MPKFAVYYRRQIIQATVVTVAADTKELASERANAALKEEDWSTIFNAANVTDVREVREI
jgi:hypothetical protein